MSLFKNNIPDALHISLSEELLMLKQYVYLHYLNVDLNLFMPDKELPKLFKP